MTNELLSDIDHKPHVTLLLCGILGKEGIGNTPYAEGIQPLSSGCSLRRCGRREYILQEENADAAAVGAGVDWARFKALMGRGVQLGFPVEERQEESGNGFLAGAPDYDVSDAVQETAEGHKAFAPAFRCWLTGHFSSGGGIAIMVIEIYVVC